MIALNLTFLTIFTRTSATDLLDDLDADKFAIFTGRENTGFVPVTPPSSKNKSASDQPNSASKSASKGSARKGEWHGTVLYK